MKKKIRRKDAFEKTKQRKKNCMMFEVEYDNDPCGIYSAHYFS